MSPEFRWIASELPDDRAAASVVCVDYATKIPRFHALVGRVSSLVPAAWPHLSIDR